MLRHVIWDWNGTLLSDQFAVLEALNAMLVDMGRPVTDVDTYRRLYTRPVRRFYEQLLDEVIDDARWDRIDEAFHLAYDQAVHRVDLHHEARTALERVAATGRTQSLLSMARHDHLVDMVGRHDIARHFTRVDGVRGVGGGPKEAWLRTHLDQLSVASADEVLMVGDAVDDAVAARAVGARVVLFDGGSHPRVELEATGAPVADGLLAAIGLDGPD